MTNKVVVSGDTATIRIKKRSGEIHEVLLDASDLDTLYQLGLTWHITPNGYARADTAVGGIRRKIYMHRTIAEPPEGIDVDHIDGNRLDNRRANLRLATRSENLQNQHRLISSNTSGFRGVSYDKQSEKWAAYYHLNGIKVSVGFFFTKEDAARAAAEARALVMPFSPEAAQTN